MWNPLPFLLPAWDWLNCDVRLVQAPTSMSWWLFYCFMYVVLQMTFYYHQQHRPWRRRSSLKIISIDSINSIYNSTLAITVRWGKISIYPKWSPRQRRSRLSIRTVLLIIGIAWSIRSKWINSWAISLHQIVLPPKRFRLLRTWTTPVVWITSPGKRSKDAIYLSYSGNTSTARSFFVPARKPDDRHWSFLSSAACRNENGCLQRYTSKMFVENTLFQSESWQRHAILARSLPPLISFPYTDQELKLFRLIVEWHLASFHFKTILPSDCLIRFEDLLDFYGALRKLRDTVSTASFSRPLPLPSLPPPISMGPPKQRLPPSSNSSAHSFELPTMGGNNSSLKTHGHQRPHSSTKLYPAAAPPPLSSAHSSNYLLQQSADLLASFASPSSAPHFPFTPITATKCFQSSMPPVTQVYQTSLLLGLSLVRLLSLAVERRSIEKQW